MLAAFLLGNAVGIRLEATPPSENLETAALYPWFSSAAKMDMINAAREKNVDAEIVREMINRARHWEEPFEDGRRSK